MSRTRAEARDYMQPARYLKLVVAGFSPRSRSRWTAFLNRFRNAAIL